MFNHPSVRRTCVYQEGSRRGMYMHFGTWGALERGGDPEGASSPVPTPSASILRESRNKGPTKLTDAVLTGLPAPGILHGKGGSRSHS